MSPTIGAGALDALAEVGNIGAGTAATALAQMTGTRVDMGVPRVALVPVEEIPERIGGGDTLVAAILLDVGGEAEGRMLFMLPADSAQELVALLMGGMAPGGGEEGAPFDEIGLSALQEIGNVLAGSYLTALGTLTGLRLEPSPPAVGVDMADALIGDAILDVAEQGAPAMLIETEFTGGDTPRVADLLFIPTPQALRAVLDRLGVAWAPR